MGKMRKSMEKASFEATKKKFWDVKRLYTTGNVICLNQDLDECKELNKKSRESAVMPVFREGLVVAYAKTVRPMKECKYYNSYIEDIRDQFPSRQEAYEHTKDLNHIDYKSLFLPFMAEIKKDGTIEYCVDVYIGDYTVIFSKNASCVISTDTMVDLAEYTVCNGIKHSQEGYYQADKDGVTCSVVFAGSLIFRILPDKQILFSGSSPAIQALKDNGYADSAEKAVKIAKENGFTLIYDCHDVVGSVFLAVMSMVNYLIEHPEEKNLSKKRKASESNGSKPDAPKNPAKSAETLRQKIFSLNSIQFRTNNLKTEKTIKSRKWERVTDCWDVRGHYRHYKNGKTVYIAPYEKGTDRNKGVKRGKMFKLE